MLGLILAATLTGCTGSAKSSSTAGSADVAGAPGAASDLNAPAPAAAPAVPQAAHAAAVLSRSVVRTASVDLRTTDVDGAANAIGKMASANGGRVESDQRSNNDKARTATIVLRVLPGRLDQVISSVVALGHETNRNVHDADVTTSRADVSARVAALATSVKRLSQLLARSGSISDLVTLEQTLTARQGDLDSMRAQEAALSEQVALASLTVNLSAPAAVLPAARAGGIHPTGFFAAIGRGFHAVVIGIGLLLAGVGYVLPALVPVGLVAAALLWWRRHRGARRPVVEGSAPTPA